MNATNPAFLPAHRRVRRKRRAVQSPSPVALTLVAASYDSDALFVQLQFDRAISIAHIAPAQVQVEDGGFNSTIYEGGGAVMIGTTAVRISLSEIGESSVSDVRLTATGATGIVATDDGGTWDGCTNLLLPFP